MLDVFNTFSTTKANIQYFYEDGVWVKPRGVSHVYMMLIGGGGNGTGTTGGGSGAVTRWFGNAAIIPDNLVIHPSNGNADNTTVSYLGSSLVTLLTANAATTNTAGTVSTNTHFGTQGFFQSTAGQAGTTGNPTSSTTTFLGCGGASNTAAQANYGYQSTSASGSFFMTQPIIVGCGASVTTGTAKNGAIGCGGSGSASSLGGSGLVIIGSW